LINRLLRLFCNNGWINGGWGGRGTREMGRWGDWETGEMEGKGCQDLVLGKISTKSFFFTVRGDRVLSFYSRVRGELLDV
jgi:hypothetical protein